ncbi:MAG: 3-deoxy-D-manno-octulosonic acid transferase [Alphaproteobacteria bacterium]|nr:3-deoxy-D-manno-octulosonic acid transferase [Alphaproteobacteria bacterium]
MLLAIYRFLMRLLAPALWGLVHLRARRGHEEIKHIHERRGVASTPRPQGKLVWIHAASVGEMRSVLPLAQHLVATNPDLHCLITTVTVTAARLVRQSGIPRVMHQYAPYDHPGWANRFLSYWKPDCVFWLESELWPTTLAAIKARLIPLIMLNGRLSERSAARWARAPRTIKGVLGLFDLCLAQSAEDAARIKALGAAQVIVAGNMKYAGPPLGYDAAELQKLQAQIGARPVVLFASTHAGEEQFAVDAARALAPKHAGLLTMIVPRHPQRGGDIAVMLVQEGFSKAQRAKGEPITASTQFYIGDTMGEMGLYFRLAPIVFLGNSLINTPGGGHNPIEPAQLGCAILYGPHIWNFAEIEKDLRLAGGSLIVRDQQGLEAALDELLRDSYKREAMGRAARSFIETQNSVFENVLAQLRPYLKRAKIAA